jgi:hypothetical protein
MQFYLGAHRAHWLAESPVPLFISHNTLRTRRSLPRARTRWALDSGAFSALALHGQHTTSPRAYAAAVRRYAEEIGQLDFAATQDWMCEPAMLKRTGGSVREHQWRSVLSFLDLRALAPELPWLPVLQGWTPNDYIEHVELYRQVDVDLTRQKLVGLGSICRRQGTKRAAYISGALAGAGIKLHGFGLKTTGLVHACHWMHSSDSMAWSYSERKQQTGQQNSFDAALRWHDTLRSSTIWRELERLGRIADADARFWRERQRERELVE